MKPTMSTQRGTSMFGQVATAAGLSGKKIGPAQLKATKGRIVAQAQT